MVVKTSQKINHHQFGFFVWGGIFFQGIALSILYTLNSCFMTGMKMNVPFSLWLFFNQKVLEMGP